MFIFNIFSRVNKSIKRKVEHKEPGLYLYLLFPISVSFLTTFTLARLISHVAPQFFILVSPDLHIHHFTYGFFILAISGYLALTLNGPRATTLVAFLHGIGLGLAFDEFGMWLRLKDDDITRWSYDGFLLIAGLILLIISAKSGFRFLKALYSLKNS